MKSAFPSTMVRNETNHEAEDCIEGHVPPYWIPFVVMMSGYIVIFVSVRITRSICCWYQENSWRQMYQEPESDTVESLMFPWFTLMMLFLQIPIVTIEITAAYIICWAFAFWLCSVMYIYFSSRKIRDNPDRDNPEILKAEDMYSHIGSFYLKTILMGFVQSMLLYFYAVGIYINGKPNFNCAKEYGFYVAGLIVQVVYVTGKDLVTREFRQNYFWINVLSAKRWYVWEGKQKSWTKLLFSPSTENGTSLDAVETVHVKIGNMKWELFARILMSKAVNSAGFILVVAVLPFQLASSQDPTEFVLNAVAAFFIIELDDLGEVVEYKSEEDPEFAITGHKYKPPDHSPPPPPDHAPPPPQESIASDETNGAELDQVTQEINRNLIEMRRLEAEVREINRSVQQLVAQAVASNGGSSQNQVLWTSVVSNHPVDAGGVTNNAHNTLTNSNNSTNVLGQNGTTSSEMVRLEQGYRNTNTAGLRRRGTRSGSGSTCSA